jgi:hypothetical protein
MRTIHIAPGHSAGGTLRQTIRDAGLADEVLFFRDDLSCGPIDSDDPAVRAVWWKHHFGDWDIEIAPLKAFWERVTTTDDHLVVWISRHSALELSFFLAWTERLGERPYNVIDVTGRRLPIRPDGLAELGPPISAVSIMPPYQLKAVLGSERELTQQERADARERWLRLKGENAPFRIVTAEGMASAPDDVFDAWILERATSEWRIMARIVGEVLGNNMEPYDQVGDLMLLTRVVALIDKGKLMADGDPWDMRSCRIRLPT